MVEPSHHRDTFMRQLQDSIEGGRFSKLVLAKPRGGEDDLQRLIVRAILLRNAPHLQFVWRYNTRDVTKNHAVTDGLTQVGGLLGSPFMNAHLLTGSHETQLSIDRTGRSSLRRTPLADAAVQADAPSVAHNRDKQRSIDISRPFLTALGVTTEKHQLVPTMARKWKQINRFVEIFAQALARSPQVAANQLRVVDFGAGKGYLTFAIFEWLKQTKAVAADVTAVELRPDLVAAGNANAAQLGFDGLRFVPGEVSRHGPLAVDVLIALHACDIATDHAIDLGVRGGAAIIMCSPCCHQEVRPQLLGPHALRPILRHGVHLDQEAEMVTDSLRALLLEAHGYDTQVFEFVSLEHTSKNKMILAVKRTLPDKVDDGAAFGASGALGAARAQVAEIKSFYGIEHLTLEALLDRASP